MFSSRVPGALAPNRLTVEIRRARSSGRSLIDLTLSNPTEAGIRYPESMLDALADRASQRYQPRSLGLPVTREAIACDYRRRGLAVAPAHIVVTASTSEAYSLLFKLLCEPSGTAALVPVPSYPLFDHLTRLDGVEGIAYRLDYHGRWAVDFGSLDAGWSDRVRAVLAVTPNNPTGSMLSEGELAGMSERCAVRDAALIIDEVFGDYPIETAVPVPSTAVFAPAPCLTFRLGGLSKSVGLPQVKLGWIAVSGPEAAVREALDRLELICDTYLSVSTPVQIAAPRLLADGAAVREVIRDRVRTNYRALRTIAAAYPSVGVLHCDGGWSAVLRVAATRSEEEIVLDLLESEGVLVHPGFFFDFDREAFLVISLLPEPAVFAEGVRRVMERADV
ncbi:MAG: pyridoxal phosphate-dependent aminotransferase [Acidobacteriota bacterium]